MKPKNNNSQKNKKNIIKIPESRKITLPKILAFILLIILGISLWSTSWSKIATNGVKTTENKDITLTQLQSEFFAEKYLRVEQKGAEIRAKKPEITKEENGVAVKTQEVDVIKVDPKMTLTDLGFLKKDNTSTLPKTEVSYIPPSAWDMILEASSGIVGTVIMFLLFIFLLTRMMGGSGGPMGGAMSFIRSRAKEYDPDAKDKVLFKDVAGSEEEKSDLEEVVDFLKNPEKYKKLWAKIPRGILLQGPPGTGKTLLARAVAGEAWVPFFSISGSEFVEMFVGVGASRVRDLFAEAREKSPSIIFIDEIDAIGKKRSPGIGGGHDEREQTLNQILTEMDGFDNDTNVIVMAATNRADVLDKALLRPGRFDRKVTINLPTLEDRKKILEVHKKNKPFADDIRWDRVAGITVGFSGAELGNLLNEAAILAGKQNSPYITELMIQKSIEKVTMGNEKKSLKMTDHEKWLTSVHEVGHAIVGKMLPHTDTVHKISILPRGGAGGVTWFLPEKDRTYTSKAKYLDELATLFAGRAAEELFLGEEYITTGASNDIERATAIARAMVMRFGFDRDLGLENYAPDASEGNYLGGGGNQEKTISEDSRKVIDAKVRELLAQAYQTAKRIISENFELHKKIAEDLLEKEEMTREEFDEYFKDLPSVPVKIEK